MQKELEEKRIGNGNFLIGYVNCEVMAFIKNCPEQICAFFEKYKKQGDITITDEYNRTVITTEGELIKKCIDIKYFFKYMYPLIVEIELGGREIEFVSFKFYE